MSIQDLTANLDLKQNLNIYARCKQFDSLNLILSIYDNSIAADLTNYNVRLKAMKADQIPLIQEHIGITIVGNDVTIEADEQLTTTSGKTLVELQFINKTTGKKKATFNLVLIIVPSTIEVNATISTATYTLLQELENKLDQCLDFFENIDEAVIANTNLVNSTNTANSTKEALDNSNTTALATKSALDTSNTNATDTKEALDLSITNSNVSKEALDTSKTNADNSKVALDLSIEAANNFSEAHQDIENLVNQVNSNTASLSDMENKITNMEEVKMSDNIKAIKNFLNKIKLGQKVKIAVFGDSLFCGAGGTPYWWQLLFLEAYRDSGHSILADFSLPTDAITVVNYAIGGTTMDAMLPHLVPQIKCNGEASGTWTQQQSELLYTTAPIEKEGYDLVIFDGGQNGGIYTGVAVEEMARRLIDYGIDTIMVSTHRGKTGVVAPTFREIYHKIASYYGCALVDMDDAYMENWDYAKANYYFDGIHQTVAGHQFYADVIRRLINLNNAKLELTPFVKQLPNGRLYWFSDVNREKQKSYACYFCNLPIFTDGTQEDANNTEGVKNPILSQGLTKDTLLNVNQSAIFSFDDAVYLIPIWGYAGSNATVNYIINGTPTSTPNATHTLSLTGTAFTDFTLDYSLYNRYQDNTPTIKRLKLLISSGSVKLLGVLVFTEPCKIYHKNTTEDYPSSVVFTGTWDNSSSYLQSNELYKRSFTDSDSVTFNTTGKKIGLSLIVSKYGGIIDVYSDGVKLTSIDTYLNQTNEGSQTYQIDLGSYGKHTVQLKLNGSNTSSITSSTIPKCGLRRIYIYEDKFDLTEKYWNDIKKQNNSI